MKRLSIRFTLTAVIAVLAFSVVYEAGAGPIFTMDAAGFRQREGLIYQEVYFLIQRDRLKFLQNADGFEAQYLIKVDLMQGDSLLSTSQWEMVDRALKLEDITPRQKLPDLIWYNLFPGDYTIRCSITDLNLPATYTENLPLSLHSFPDSGLALSDIELAMKLQRGEEGSKFYKNGFLIIPNPERVFGTSLPMLYYYVEIYNLIPGEGNYIVRREILDGDGNVVHQLPKKVKQKIAASVVEVDGFSVISLTSGTYFLRIAAEDDDTGETTSSQVKFFVYRPEDFAKTTGESTSASTGSIAKEFESYTDEQLEEAIGELKYLLSDSDWRMVENLNSEGQRKYLIKYWTETDPNPNTPVNEYRQIFEQRKQQANEKYGLWEKPGWKTDRGRILLLYGEPDDVEYHPHDPGTRAYEVWYYDALEGGVQFVFVDRSGFGDYRLVHSNKKGELYRPNWFEEEALLRKP
jgi:GWxTD domain-containing protein